MAKKSKTVFICQECGFESSKWMGKCPCGAWNSFVEEKVFDEADDDVRKRGAAKTGTVPKPTAVTKVDSAVVKLDGTKMDDKGILALKGLEKLEMDNVVAEALIHPCKYNEQVKNHHSVEFGITQDRDLEDKIKRLGFDIVNYKG